MENSSSPSGSPSIKEALTRAADVGREQREAGKEAVARRLDEWKNRGRRAIARIKETGQKVKNAVDTVANIGVGLSTNSEVRKALAEAVGHQVGESGRALLQGSKEMGIKILHKGEDILDKGADKLRAIGDGVNERVIRPVVERARKVEQAVVQGAEAGALFVATPVIELGEAAYSAGKAVYEQGKKGVEQSKEAIERGIRKAKKWGERVGDFFQRQGENLRNGIDRTRREIKALPLEAAALPRRAEAGVERLVSTGLEKILPRLTSAREKAINAANAKREKAARIRNGERIVKTGT